MIDAPNDVYDLGHVGWAFADGENDWAFGSTEANNNNPKQYEPNPSWDWTHSWERHGSWNDLLQTFANGSPYGRPASIAYLQYRCGKPPKADVTDAETEVGKQATSGFWILDLLHHPTVAANDCLTKAVKILQTYGAVLPDDPVASLSLGRPNDYFDNHLPGFDDTAYLWSVSLTTDASDPSNVPAGTTVNLTADASLDVAFTPFYIVITDQSSGEAVETCGDGSACTAEIPFDGTDSASYVAEVSDLSGNVVAQSSPQQITWVGSSDEGNDGGDWTVTLSADQTDVQAGDTVNFTAQASQDVWPTPYYIVILDQGTGMQIAGCGSGESCSGPAEADAAGTDSFVAQIADVDGNVVAQSDPVQVTWEDGSSSGQSSGTSGTNLGTLDLNGYCQYLGGQGASLDGSTAYDWHCIDSNGDREDIDVNEACQWQFADMNATAVVGDINDPYSWSCQDTTTS